MLKTKRVRWTKEEDAKLIKMYDKIPAAKTRKKNGYLAPIAKTLGRTITSCYKRVNKLKAKRRNGLNSRYDISKANAAFLEGYVDFIAARLTRDIQAQNFELKNVNKRLNYLEISVILLAISFMLHLFLN